MTLPIISDKKFDGVKVIVESQSGPVISGPIQIFGPIWEKATGATIELVTYPFGQMFEKLRTEFSSGAYTVRSDQLSDHLGRRLHGRWAHGGSARRCAEARPGRRLSIPILSQGHEL